MSNIQSVSVDLGRGKILTIETGRMAHQAAGAVTVRLADTILFSAVTCSSSPREGIDYFPLQVEYREKFYAAGRFPGGFFKRETRPAEKEILTSRVTDRPIRPLFPKGYHNDVQINNMLLSADGINDSDMLSIVASSASLTLSEIPFMGPIAGVRVCRVDGEFVINPTHDEREKSDFDLVYCGKQDVPMMIEGDGQEVSEADIVAAMRFGQEVCDKIIAAQLELRSKLGLPAKVIEEASSETELLIAARELAGTALLEALAIADKLERQDKVHAVKDELKTKMEEKFEAMTKEEYRSTFDDFEIETVRDLALNQGKRMDGRAFAQLRELDAEVSLLPRTHGSALFARGETQALGILTLGTKSDIQRMDAVTGGVDSKNFMVHYNFPPYSVGEAGRLGFTGRREIGHGALAEKSLRPVLPDDYPYTVRLVSDIMGSNGSSSMASVCVGTLALMDAGVPIKRPVAGISVGLFTDGTKSELVTDIIGSEDHCGDMDFKVAGTREGITGFQVDMKIPGLAWDLVEGAFELARKTRLELIDFMESVIPAPREDMSEHAPRISQVTIPVDKIGELIGPGGKNIRRITEMTGAQIDIEEDGTVSIFATNADVLEQTVREVEMVTAEPEIDRIYDGRVSGVKEFGAFVEIFPGTDGLVHISELADCRVNSVDDICKVGDQMWVKCIGIDDRGRIKLSRREAMQDMDQQQQDAGEEG
ncbi:MAG: polyribonucleotide nucleotidyltransferase [Verrucomicrobia bacterium]|jgi:polyribonucleotide nucleotidyltransferase|nr:polyribonucleotide nucleotidyltransferase [Verrucomicrobiota bacterium]MBT7065372.1 polyribonucleotide nucleotidyltransferase [Verrucomicrobiota bacterium]MBT7701322.1 polyribonucleotide nucleotidyltransferase [Verrucomicrobiota bacterium]